MSDQLFTYDLPTTGSGVVAETKHGVTHFIYLTAIGAAEIGWLWLMAWAAMRLLGSLL
jgi:hypothetical protein